MRTKKHGRSKRYDKSFNTIENVVGEGIDVVFKKLGKKFKVNPYDAIFRSPEDVDNVMNAINTIARICTKGLTYH